MASVLRTSMVGAKAAVSATAATFASRLARLRSRKRAMFVSARLNAWASRMPVISSWSSAVTSPVVSRVMRKAGRAREDDADQPKQRPEQLCQPLRQELIQGVDVIGGATHEVAKWSTTEERERQPPETLEQLTAQAGQEALPNGPNLEDLGTRGQGADGVHGDQAGQGPHQAGASPLRRSPSIARLTSQGAAACAAAPTMVN